MPIEDFPATDSGIFRNPPRRKITLQWRQDGTLPNEEDMRAFRELLLTHDPASGKSQVEVVTKLLNELDEWAHRVLLEELRKSDPEGDYIFAQGPCQIAPGPEGDLVFRGIWKVVADSAKNTGGRRFESVALPSHKSHDADSVLRITVEQRMRIASLLHALPPALKESVRVEQQLGVALFQMYRLGWKACQVFVRDREPDAGRGKKVMDAAKQGHEQTHGTAEQKQRKWAEYQKEVDRLRMLHPNWSKANINHRVATKFDVVPRTIRRHTQISPQPASSLSRKK